MKRYLLLLIPLLFGACKEISFQEPQPQGKKILQEVPETLHGKYIVTDEEGASKDTLTIDAHGYSIGHNPEEKAVLSDSLVLKHYKGYYFVNINERPEWILRVLQQQGNGDLTYMEMESDEHKFNQFIRQLSKEIKVDSLDLNGEKLYQIDPTPKQLVSLINKGYFKKITFKKLHGSGK